MYQRNHLSHLEAQQMIEHVRARLAQDGQAAAIAVVDDHGELIAFLRMDGCKLPPISIAINKAFTAARECRESGEIGAASQSRGFPITNYGDLRYTGWAGGIPVLCGDAVIGAIGISGVSSELEQRLGRQAAALVSP